VGKRKDSGISGVLKKKESRKAGSHKDVTILLVGTGVLDGPRHILLRSKQIFNPDKFATKSVGVHY